MNPTEDRVLIMQDGGENSTSTGIILAPKDRAELQHGTVVAVGPGRWNADGSARIPIDVAIGDRVFHTKFSGTHVDFDGEEHLMIRETDIMAVI